MECLDFEHPIRTVKRGSAADTSVVCADKRCLRDPNYFQVHFVENRIAPKSGVVSIPGLLKRCRSETFTLDYTRNEEPEYSLVKEYAFAASGLYAETFLPSHVYRSVRDESTGRWRADVVFPKTIRDLPSGFFGSNDKLRVRSDEYDALLDFCRFSIHTHAGDGGKLAVCCKRLCSRPAPLTKMELWAIKRIASKEPYYTGSWLEKNILFKWHVGEERFDPFLSFESAIAVYCEPELRHDPTTTELFTFRCWKTPDENVKNADEIYFRSPINLAGYKWYEPTSLDRENEERYRVGTEYRSRRTYSDTNDAASDRIARKVMNLRVLPTEILLSSKLIVPCSFREGTPTVNDSECNGDTERVPLTDSSRGVRV